MTLGTAAAYGKSGGGVGVMVIVGAGIIGGYW